MSNQPEQEMNQILQGLLGSPATPSGGKVTDDALLRSLFGLMQEQAGAESNLDSLLPELEEPALTALDDATLMTRLEQQFLDLCETFVELKVRPAAASQPEVLVRLESYLAGAQAEIEALMPEDLLEVLPAISLEDMPAALAGASVLSPEPITAQKKTLKLDS